MSSQIEWRGPVVVLLMGVTGSGKTTVGTLLARELGWEFDDADWYHPAANIEKMSQGIPLDDVDRVPWLAALREAILNYIAEKKNVVLACSALKWAYRQELVVGPEVRLVYLKGSYELIAARLRRRLEHFANEKILAGQFRDLEEPEDAVVVDVEGDPVDVVKRIRELLDRSQESGVRSQ
jgi:gluconokinase